MTDSMEEARPASAPSPAGARSGTPGAWLELVRPANVTTALADVLAGFAVAGLAPLGSLPWLLGATAALYAGGIVLNDYFDRHLDAVERPERPIPSGRIAPGAAAAAGTGLLAGGVLAALMAGPTAGLVAAGIAGLVVGYDAWGKRQQLPGPLMMGGCRALNLLLGVSAAPTALAGSWPLAALPLTYITGVTVVSRGEVLGGSRPAAGLGLAAVLSVVVALVVLSAGTASVPGLLLAGALAWRVVPAFGRAYNDAHPAAIRRAVRTGVLSLVLLDAVIGAVFAGALYSLVILATALLAGWLARRFAVT